MERNYQLLNQFWAMKCEVTFHSRLNDVVSTTYTHQSFYYEITDDYIYLKDSLSSQNDTCVELRNVLEVKNLCDDLYHDVIDLITNEYIISVCCLEEKSRYPKCHKCGNEICIPEDEWHVHGYDGYENPYDGDIEIVESLSFCSKCVVGFVGEIESNIIEYMI